MWWLRRMYALPLVVLACVTLPHLGQGEFNVDTGWYSAIALQAWRAAGHGDWGALWTLRGYGSEGGEAFFNKPPLGFWVHGLVLWMLGPSVWAARLPTVVAGAGVVALTVSTVARLSGRRAAVMSGIVLALSLEFTRQLRAFSLDAWQVLFLMAAVRLVVEGERSGRGKFVAWAGVPLGLAVMTKPLMGLVALPVLAGWLVWEGRDGKFQISNFKSRTAALGMLGVAGVVAVAVAAPWHGSMWSLHEWGFAGAYFGREVVDRAAGRLAGANIGAESPLYYLKELGTRYWPWLATVALACVAWGRGQLPGRGERAMRLGMVWTAAWLVLLSVFPDKRPRYVLMAYPAWAWMSGVFMVYAAPGWFTRARRAVRRWWPRVIVVGAVALAIAPVRVDRQRETWWPDLFVAVRAAGYSPELALWEAGRADGARGARVYLELGRWPQRAWDGAGTIVARPGPGSLLMYHEMDGWGPGAGEAVLFREGPLTLTRVGEREWAPVRVGK